MMTAHLDFSMECLLKRKANLPDNDIAEVFGHIWKGGFADVQSASEEMAQAYYQSYIDNYLIADAVNEKELRTFPIDADNSLIPGNLI